MNIRREFSESLVGDIPDFACPSCHKPVTADPAGWRCLKEEILFPTEDGIPRFLLSEGLEALNEFLETYLRVRRLEGWGDGVAQYYRALPYLDKSGAHEPVWRVRARTFDCFLLHFSRQVAQRRVRCLDIGAGNCWFAARIAELGHSVVALDINLDPRDGLKALSNFDVMQRCRIVPAQADFDALPFGPESFDIVIFNASLHYSPDIWHTISEAMGVLRSQGVLYILDSPIYRNVEAGEQMIEEQRRSFAMRLGIALHERRLRGYVTESMLHEMEAMYRTETLLPSYGLRWKLRPLVATILGRRDPASFKIIVLHKD